MRSYLNYAVEQLNIKVDDIFEGDYFSVALLPGHCTVRFLGQRKTNMFKK